MAIPITVPRLGWNMEEGVFGGWLKADGDTVRPGDVLFRLESEKATEEIESLDAGILRIPADGPKEGDRVTVGAVIGHLMASADERAATEPPPAAGRPAAVPEPAASPAVRRLARELGIDLSGVPGTGPGGRISAADVEARRPATLKRQRPEQPGAAISPRARRVAAELGIDWSALNGSGRTGRIRESDVRSAAALSPSPPASGGAGGGGGLGVKGASAPGPGTPSPHAAGPSPLTPAPSPPALRGRGEKDARIRRVIAARLVESLRATAPVTLTTTADATNLANLRGQYKAVPDNGPVPSYTDLLLKLSATALQKHPALTGQWTDDGIRLPDGFHIGIAVETDTGLLVPVVRDVPTLNLRKLAARSRDLIDRARSGRLSAADMQGGCFTVTNLGAYGIDAFTPIINYPECAILGVGRIAKRPAVLGDAVVARDQVTLSLTFDHRIVDGAPAARFLQTLTRMIENPAPWLAT